MESQLQSLRSSKEVLTELYDRDPAQWLQVTVGLLRQNALADMDWAHVIEELESLGKRDRNRVAHLLEQLIRHWLLLQYWKEEQERNQNHWRAEIQNFRTQLRRHLTTTLKNYLDEELPQIYEDALGYVQEKTGHGVDFPLICPYSLTELLESFPLN